MPSEPPTPRKLKRTARQPSCRQARASVCTTLLSIVPPCCGCGWQITAVPTLAELGASMAHSSGPAGPASICRTVCAFTPSAPDARRQQQSLDHLAVLQVRIDDLVDVVRVDIG